ncbi:MAG: TIGR04211 family SH3 domain-containing protein [Steroidobacteraceae bacterium]
MKRLGVLLLALAAVPGWAATAYVSDELVLGVYSEQNQQGQRLTTLHSGASVETLSIGGEFTQVRLSDGVVGWVKAAYLTESEPAIVRVKRLEEELDRSRATSPALAEAAARSELERLQGELAAAQSQLNIAQARQAESAGGSAAARRAGSITAGFAVSAALIAALCGFWLGYVTLAHRVKRKFGGIKIY